MLIAMNISETIKAINAIRVDALDETKVAKSKMVTGPAAAIPHLTTNMVGD